MKKPIKITIYVFSLLIFAYVCSLVAVSKAKRNYLISYANSKLYDVEYTLDVLEYIENNRINDQVLKDKLEYAMLSSLYSVSIVKPKMEDLQGTPLSSLCRSIAYKKKNGIGIPKDKTLAKTVADFLEGIESDLKSHIKSYGSFPINGCENFQE